MFTEKYNILRTRPPRPDLIFERGPTLILTGV